MNIKGAIREVIMDGKLFLFLKALICFYFKKNGEEVQLKLVTQKQLYEETLLTIHRDHHSQIKWVEKLDTAIVWEDVWKTVHNLLSTNLTKTTIWQQIHLNFYTQYSYNKWHKKKDLCPLCKKLPENIYHIILHCEFVNELWEKIDPVLKAIHPGTVTEEEKAFGIVQKKQTTGIVLRNWLTYLLRECIAKEERTAYHSSKIPSSENTKQKFNFNLQFEINAKVLRYQNENNLDFFDKMITRTSIM